MRHVAMTRLGKLWILHRDDPTEREIKRRLAILLMAPLPHAGALEVWPGARRDEVCWRRLMWDTEAQRG